MKEIDFEIVKVFMVFFLKYRYLICNFTLSFPALYLSWTKVHKILYIILCIVQVTKLIEIKLF